MTPHMWFPAFLGPQAVPSLVSGTPRVIGLPLQCTGFRSLASSRQMELRRVTMQPLGMALQAMAQGMELAWAEEQVPGVRTRSTVSQGGTNRSQPQLQPQLQVGLTAAFDLAGRPPTLQCQAMHNFLLYFSCF